MNENTTKLIETLANKLGTTSEYLWRVLLKQAPIAATTELVFMVFLVIAGYFLWKAHKYLSNNENSQSYYNEDSYEIIMIILACGYLALLLFSINSIPVIINGYFNPEYWALKEILNSLKN